MKKKIIDTKGGGLNTLPEDSHDFLLAGVFGQIDTSVIPRIDFDVAKPLKIKDQGESDMCSAFAVTSVSEDQEGMELVPQYNFFRTKEIMGDFESWGADLRSAAKSIVKFGSLPAKNYEDFLGLSRSSAINHLWTKEHELEARKHAKETFFKIGGKYDTFDNIRTALWQFRHERRTIVVGAKWRSEWTSAQDGIIPKEYSDEGFGHAFKIFGQKIINDEIYLKAQLSNGDDIGDGGIFYFPRSVVNKEFSPYGQFMFKDMPRGDAEFYIDNGLKVNDSKLKKFIVVIINFIKELF